MTTNVERIARLRAMAIGENTIFLELETILTLIELLDLAAHHPARTRDAALRAVSGSLDGIERIIARDLPPATERPC